MLSMKQNIILNEANKKGLITLSECVDLVGGDIYANKNKHVGQILSRMVKRGLIERVKNGLYTPVKYGYGVEKEQFKLTID